jgi:hypothetical protein
VTFSPAPSGAGPPGGGEERQALASHGRSLTPMTPKRPPKGMVLPNAFGLLSMQSFKKASMSGDDSARCPSTIAEVRPVLAPPMAGVCSSCSTHGCREV